MNERNNGPLVAPGYETAARWINQQKCRICGEPDLDGTGVCSIKCALIEIANRKCICGSNKKIKDPQSGEVICKSCGLVLKEAIL